VRPVVVTAGIMWLKHTLEALWQGSKFRA
jgi:hypothetical protein